MRSNEVAPSRRRWPLLGAAAGLIAVAVVGVALAATWPTLLNPMTYAGMWRLQQEDQHKAGALEA